MKLLNLILLVLISFKIHSQDILNLRERAKVIEEIQKDIAEFIFAVKEFYFKIHSVK